MSPKANDELSEWCKETNGSDDWGHVIFLRGKINNYLSILMNFTPENALKIDMKYYIKGM